MWRILCIVFCINLFSLNLGPYKGFDRIFHAKMKKEGINEPFAHAMCFNNHIILIGAVSNSKNINKLLLIAHSMFKLFAYKTNEYYRTFAAKNKILNFLIYNKSSENSTLAKKVYYKLQRNRYINIKRYVVFVMGKFVWVVGQAKTCYERDQVIALLSLMKKRQEIAGFYKYIDYIPSKELGFVYKHK